MAYVDHAKVEPGKPKFSSHKQGRYACTGEGYLEHNTGDRIDLHALLTNHSPFVHLVPIDTNIMRVSGLHHGGIAVVNKSLKPQKGSVIVVRFNGVVLIRRLNKKNNRWCLIPDDPREEVLYITSESIVENLGVVTHSINYIA